MFKTLHKELIHQALEELDSQSIAELKSYSQPPPQIHKVIYFTFYFVLWLGMNMCLFNLN